MRLPESTIVRSDKEKEQGEWGKTEGVGMEGAHGEGRGSTEWREGRVLEGWEGRRRARR